MKHTFKFLIVGLLSFFVLSSCDKDDPDNSNNGNNGDDLASHAIVLLIDEQSIDNGNPPNTFSETDVNDQLAEIGLRTQLKYFSENVGKTIALYTGEVGDEGWFALKRIPETWKDAGPTDFGTRNFLLAGPGLGAPDQDDNREALLDEVRDVTPLRATGLAMLIGRTVLAVVYDSDISINYDPLQGSLKGANLGMVAFEVMKVEKRIDGSSSSLPKVTIKILNTQQNYMLGLFANAPAPQSSSEPFDVDPPASPNALVVFTAP